MLLTIGITFWDKDYTLYSSLLAQIRKRVKVPYELVIIDNTEGSKLGSKASYAFGHNAKQFASRYKVIKLAKGDYIWFIDGDDEVVGLDSSLFSKPFDMLCTSFISNDRECHVKEGRLKVSSDCWKLIQEDIAQALWNKIIRTDLFKDVDRYVDNPELAVVSLEDTFYVALALKRARYIELKDIIIYKKNEGFSDMARMTREAFDNLTTGFEDILRLFAKLKYDVEAIKESHFHYFMYFMHDSVDPGYIAGRLIKLFGNLDFWQKEYYMVLSRISREADYKIFRSAFVERFGEENIPKQHYTEYLSDGSTNTVYYEAVPVFGVLDKQQFPS